MLTTSEIRLLPSMLLRHLATSCLDLVKMRPLVPKKIENEILDYKCHIKEMVFDPGKIPETNKRFEAAGYILPEKVNVIAVNADQTILVWDTQLNCVLWLRKGEPATKDWEANMAFEDLVDLTEKFDLKHKKAEIDAMVEELKSFGARA